MKSPAMRWLGMLVWAITAIASIGIGLAVFGTRVDMMPIFLNNPQLLMMTRYIVGASGIISLIMFLMAVTTGCCGCGCNSCK